MDLDLGWTASFLVLADEQHYGRAADRLHLTTPALTKRIQRLERRLGVALVERGPAGVLGLTAAGVRFAAAAGPLLAQARAAAESARGEAVGYPLRVGVPAGSGSFLRFIDVAGIERDIRRAFPPVRVSFVQVPFPRLSRCLPEDQIDVLLTIAPVCHRDVESFPLPLTSPRIGLVSARHPLADAPEVDVAEFCEHALLCNPDIPEEWMRQFWLADVRPRKEARLVTTHAANNPSVMRDALAGTVAMVSLEPARTSLPIGLNAVTLVGADPLTFHAARRRTDRRGVVRTYLELFRALEPRCLA